MVQEARENPPLEVLDWPAEPERKSFPPRLLIIGTGTGCAVILSGVWILGLARWREMDALHPGKVLAGEILRTAQWPFAISGINREEQDSQSDKCDGSAGEPTKVNPHDVL
jgi:hypothetical protein